MTPDPMRILFIEDAPRDAELAVRALQARGLEFTWMRVDSKPALLDALATWRVDVIICDYAMPGFGGREALALSIAHDPAIPFITLTGVLSDETVVSCLKAGAWDYVLKDNAARLPFAVQEALSRRRANAEVSATRAAIAESERRYRTLANSGRALIWTAGLDKKCDYFNQPWLDFTGRTLEEELGDGWVEGVHPDDVSRCVSIYAAAFDEQRPFTAVYRLRRHDGEYRSIQDDGSPRYDSQGTFLGYIGHCLDITALLRAEQERSQFEAALAHAQRFEAVGRLAGGVSHDFNNLLTGILGYCDLLLASMPTVSPYRADVVQIQAVAQRASTLSRQLLAFSRKQALRPVALNLTTLMSDLRRSVRTVLRETIEVVWDLAPGVDDIEGDPGQIEQAVFNLLNNANDAMPGGGQVTIRTAQTTMDDAFVADHPGASPGRCVALSVSDNGPGIEPHLLPLLFKPFFTTKEPGIETGLGLAAVYGIVKMSGGYVSVESTVGHGSTFTMYFPSSVGSPVLASAPLPVSFVDIRGSETILLAEDDAGLRELLARVLTGYGYTVLEAVDGLDATTRWLGEAGRIDLLITDLVMPGLPGVEVARLFREARPALPVVFATGYVDPAIFQGLSMDAHTDIVHKPFLPSLLLQKVRHLLEGGRPANPGG